MRRRVSKLASLADRLAAEDCSRSERLSCATSISFHRSQCSLRSAQMSLGVMAARRQAEVRQPLSPRNVLRKKSWNEIDITLNASSSAAEPDCAKYTFRSRRCERIVARARMVPVKMACTSHVRIKVNSRTGGRFVGVFRKENGRRRWDLLCSWMARVASVDEFYSECVGGAGAG